MAIAFDPLSPEYASSSKDHTTFKTLTRERRFRHAPTDESDVAVLDELVKPHIESFNALMGDEAGMAGLLQLGVKDIDPKVVIEPPSEDSDAFGAKLACASTLLSSLAADFAYPP